MSFQRIDQGMARRAANALPSPVTPSVRTRFRTLRVMLHTSGLAATYAFVASKAAKRSSKDAADYAMVRSTIEAHLRDEMGLLGADSTSPDQVLSAIAAWDVVDYLRASAEVGSLFTWLARLADATVEKPPTQEPDEGGRPDAT